MLSIFDQGPPPPCPDPFNLAAHVLGQAGRFGSKVALSVLEKDTAQDWTYQELEQAVRGTGTGLLNAGLSVGDIVLMRLGNTVDFPIAYLGAIAAGLVPVPTSSATNRCRNVANHFRTISGSGVARPLRQLCGSSQND